jgi:hypothetical protein
LFFFLLQMSNLYTTQTQRSGIRTRTRRKLNDSRQGVVIQNSSSSPVSSSSSSSSSSSVPSAGFGWCGLCGEVHGRGRFFYPFRTCRHQRQSRMGSL